MRNRYKVLTKKDVEKQIKNYNKNYSTPKWLLFCKESLELGFKVSLHKAVTTYSKYILIEKDDKKTKIRFSNHKPNKRMQEINDSDYYVGVSHFGCIRTEELIEELKVIYDLKTTKGVNMTQEQKLLNEWLSLKEIEDTAKKQREKISNELEMLYKLEDGKKSGKFTDGEFEIEIKKNERAQIDQDEAKHLREHYAMNVLPFRLKYELDAKKYYALKEMEPAFYKRCSEAVTFVPGKTSVKVSWKEKE